MFDPYSRWFNIPVARWPLTHYQLLGVSEAEQNARVIEDAAMARSARVRAFQLRYPDEATRVLNEIAQAMVTLLDPVHRDEYDAGLERAASREAMGRRLPTTSARSCKSAASTPTNSSRLVGGVVRTTAVVFFPNEAGAVRAWRVKLRPVALSVSTARALRDRFKKSRSKMVLVNAAGSTTSEFSTSSPLWQSLFALPAAPTPP
jgi:hypothetical protein